MIMDDVKPSFDGQAALPNLGVIRVQGADAANFLHNQLTQDMLHLDASGARLAAWCSAKGRMLVSLIAVRPQGEEVLLLCPRELIAPTLKRLQMFVLRAKVRLSDATTEFRIHGVLGSAVAALAGSPLAPWQRVVLGDACLIGLYPHADNARALWVGPATAVPPACPMLTPGLWEWAEVNSGVVLIGLPTVEAFVPQMLNYESVGGVNFKKGCYPGQEVVARSQFRGTLKRRAFLVEGSLPLAAGDALFAPSDVEQPCATVVQAAQGPQGGWRALVSGQVSALAETELLHASADGQRLRPLPVPYPLLAEV
jgi:tRNA-modifying protein YgfZ